MLPAHGKISCRQCFSSAHEKVCAPNADWRIVNDPGAWGGGENPDYLVLGFSKGATQANIYEKGVFEDVAFAKMRPRLTQALQAVGVLPANETADEKIANPNSNIAFGSLIRCSVSRYDKKESAKKESRIYACTGQLITKSFSEIPEIVSNCTKKFMVNLPNSIKTVIFLSNSDAYVLGCQNILRTLFPKDFRLINPMSSFADGRGWVHVAHASGLNGHSILG